MDVTGAGTAVMLAIAAALWFAYFVPTWIRRREYLDTERTATRLQQTLRVMAETAELPDEVRVEVRSRDAVRAERLLIAQQRRRDGIAAQQLARVGSATLASGSSIKVRRRRARRLASLLMIAATVTIAVQLWLVVTGSAGSGAWMVLAAGVVLGVAGVAVRRRLEARAAPAVVAEPAAAPARASAVEPPRTRQWTPIPVPAPLYASRPEVQRVQPSLDLVAQARAAALEAERAAHVPSEVIPIRRARPEPLEVPEPPAAPSRWAAMGRIDSSDGVAPDLDEVLRRRRTAG